MLNIIISFQRKSTRHSWPIASLAHVQRKSPCQCVVRKHIIKGKPGLWIFTKSGNSIKSYHFLGIILRHYICYLRFCSHHLRISRHSQYRILTDNTFLLIIDGPFRMKFLPRKNRPQLTTPSASSPPTPSTSSQPRRQTRFRPAPMTEEPHIAPSHSPSRRTRPRSPSPSAPPCRSKHRRHR